MEVCRETARLWPDEVPALVTIGDAADLLSRPGVVARHNQALLGLPGFRPRYEARGPLTPAPPAGAPAGTLARVLADFMAWYELQVGFFPSDAGALAAMDPTEFAAHMLAVYHDVLHVIAGHNTSDLDEVSLQSLLFGQAPIAFASFIARVRAAPDLATALRYKHLRDLLACPLDREAAARGRAARPLLDLAFESLWYEPLVGLRRRLGLGPRTPAAGAERNTCGRPSGAHFFV